MASISTEKANGRRAIQFVDHDGSRRTIRFGKATKVQAEQAKRHIEAMLSAKLSGTALDRQTSLWLADVGEVMHDKLAKVGLCESREVTEVPAVDDAPIVTLEIHLQSFFAKRDDVKPSTKVIWGHTRRNLLTHFGAGKPIADITEADAESFQRMLRKSLSPSTVGKRTKFARQFLQDAVKQRLIDRNPF